MPRFQFDPPETCRKCRQPLADELVQSSLVVLRSLAQLRKEHKDWATDHGPLCPSCLAEFHLQLRPPSK